MQQPRISRILLLTLFLTSISTIKRAKAQLVSIKNDIFWDTQDGHPIYSQGGGIFKFISPKTGEQKYYWYGVHYKGAELYRKDPSLTQNRASFEAVTCYSSGDLAHWKFEGEALTKEEVYKHDSRTSWVGRLGVAYLQEWKKYALFVQHNKNVLIALSDNPTGPFTWHRKIDMTDRIGTPNTGDQTVFTDEDTGKSYLVYSYGRGRNKIYISEIGIKEDKVDLLDCTEIYRGAGREGNCMFKYRGKYYMYASNLYGWDASYAYYMVADDIRGPYKPENNMLVTKGSENDYAHVTQTGFFVNVKGSKEETVIYCGDRWADFAGNGLGYNQWIPLSFSGDEPYFNSLNSWELNAQTGEWQVAKDNNYVKNGSFEADRKLIPSHNKPVQEQLTGWTTEILQGNKTDTESPDSPVLNYLNTRADRSAVIGEKSLQITDKINFERRVYQIIASSPYVPLQDGKYKLTAKVKNSKGFSTLNMYAKSQGKEFRKDLKEERLQWGTVEIDAIQINGGKVEIGFEAEGRGGANCLIDDISLVRIL